MSDNHDQGLLARQNRIATRVYDLWVHGGRMPANNERLWHRATQEIDVEDAAIAEMSVVEP